MIKIIVDNIIRIDTTNMNENLLEIIKKKFTYSNPQFWKDNAMGFKTDEPRYLKTYAFNKQTGVLKISRGAITILRSILDAYKIKHEVIDRRVLVPYEFKFFNEKPLWGIQIDSVDKLAANSQQILIAPPAAGKTRTMAKLIETIGQKTMIVVHTSEIFKNWKEEIELSLNVKRAGLLGLGKKILEPVTIAMIQSLMRCDDEDWDIINKNFGCVIISECQHVPATMFYNVMNRFKAKYRYGESASKTRKDKKEFLMYDCISHRTFEVTEEDMKEIKKSLPVDVHLMYISLLKYKGEDWTTVIGRITKNKERNEFIVNQIINDVKDGHVVLVLADRKKHCMELGQILNEKGVKAGVFTSKVKIKNRVEIVKDINDGNTKVLVATINLLSEGANIPILSCLHLVTPSNNIELERQKIGRIRRVVEGKKSPVVRDYVDEKNEFLSNMAKSRKKHYKKLNFNVIEVKC